MNTFKEFWKHIYRKSENLDDIIAEETEDHHKYHQMADEADCTSDMKLFDRIAEDEAEHADILARMKTTVEKPGVSIHSPKWDRCVQHVKDSGSGANAYAVCTAMLGEESFKSIEDDITFGEKMKMYLQKLGITGEGPIPNSLLSEQDLEGEPKINITRLDRKWFVNSEKGQLDKQNEELENIAEEAEEVQSKKETKSLLERIKNIQLKRQKTVLSMRDNIKEKSFKKEWNKITKV